MKNLLPDEQTTLKTYDKIARLWADHHDTADFWAKEARLFHGLLPKGKILDIGAGGGRDLKLLEGLGYQYEGTEISSGLIEVLRRRYPKHLFHQQSIYELAFPSRFDGFWCAAVLLHIPKSRITEALKAIHSIVRKGGIGFVSIKDGDGEHMEVEKLQDGTEHGRLFVYYSKTEFADLLKRQKFQVAEYTYRPDSQKTRWHCFFVQTRS